MIIDLFGFCAREDRVLSQALEGDFAGFIFESDDTKQAPETEMDTTNTEPQPNSMDMKSQSKFEWLCNKKLMVSDFEATLDGLVGDGHSIISEFIDWEVLVPHTPSTN